VGVAITSHLLSFPVLGVGDPSVLTSATSIVRFPTDEIDVPLDGALSPQDRKNESFFWPSYEMSAITHLFGGVPVSDLEASIEWYTRFFGRVPDSRVGDEVLWEIDERAWLFIEPSAARAGAGGSPSPSAGSMRCSSASLPSASSMTRSRSTRTESATRISPTRTGTRSRSPSRRTPRARHLDRPDLRLRAADSVKRAARSTRRLISREFKKTLRAVVDSRTSSTREEP
jgi:hypothetical protein